MICDPRCDLSWRIFYEHLRRKCILPLSGGMSYKYQLSLFGLLCHLKQGFLTPGPQTCTSTSLWPVRNQATQQEVSSRRASKLHLPLPITPHHSHYQLNLPPSPIHGKIVFYETSPWCRKMLGTTDLMLVLPYLFTIWMICPLV